MYHFYTVLLRNFDTISLIIPSVALGLFKHFDLKYDWDFVDKLTVESCLSKCGCAAKEKIVSKLFSLCSTILKYADTNALCIHALLYAYQHTSSVKVFKQTIVDEADGM